MAIYMPFMLPLTGFLFVFMSLVHSYKPVLPYLSKIQ